MWSQDSGPVTSWSLQALGRDVSISESAAGIPSSPTQGWVMSMPCRGTVPPEDGGKDCNSEGHSPMACSREVVPGRAHVGSGSAEGPVGKRTGRVGSHGTWGEGRLDCGHHGLQQDRTQPLFLRDSAESFHLLPSTQTYR
ncbi:unnamed protein product [Rangifer tarandus platyrhynchus]|uniref:Uncharacterized protein n=2 Tax=Rangifer tarandus platyrhynchus TaxID=3082113 RepID=A0ABN8YWE5_RANTA|nr:unnamed protein product [Rangifer tarandus platyrhynchus]